IGFAAGYLTGTKAGKDGLERMRSSVRAIAQSAEARRLATEAVTIASAIVGRNSARGAAKSAAGMARLLIRQITEPASER
ncbi:MAG TPA: hypothetical protein VF843_15130, partial [Streptosporangiaceae bacterium]